MAPGHIGTGVLAVLSKLPLHNPVLHNGLSMAPHEGKPCVSPAPVLEAERALLKATYPSTWLHLELHMAKAQYLRYIQSVSQKATPCMVG